MIRGRGMICGAHSYWANSLSSAAASFTSNALRGPAAHLRQRHLKLQRSPPARAAPSPIRAGTSAGDLPISGSGHGTSRGSKRSVSRREAGSCLKACWTPPLPRTDIACLSGRKAMRARSGPVESWLRAGSGRLGPTRRTLPFSAAAQRIPAKPPPLPCPAAH